MTISYKWLSEYLPVTLTPERLARILTSIGLEVEEMQKYQEVTGGLEGLVIGHVLDKSKHPNADKLSLTKVSIGDGLPLQIVCGAPNVAAGQKVVVAPVGATIYPAGAAPVTMKLAKIRGEESHGMICAEDEIGMGQSHDGILILSEYAVPGTPAAEYFQLYTDVIYEIGLTPNRMDAMSHWGVARDVCAYLSLHDKQDIKPIVHKEDEFEIDNQSLPIDVKVENHKACPRYSGVSLANVKIGESPKWLQQKLKAIGLRPINNIVDITNYILHDVGQPLHAFDIDKIADWEIVVKNVPGGTPFTTLDNKTIQLHAEDLLICDSQKPMCIAGVYGGINSGVTESTTNIFLESAFFDTVNTRRTSFRHNLRTDAAGRFEKGTDISATVKVLKRAAALIKEIAGGEIASDVVDIYSQKQPKKEVAIKWHFIKKLSGKSYHPDTVKNILSNLGFETVKESVDELIVAVPYHKPDIHVPADLVEEIVRIDGLDNIDIPATITITPAITDREDTTIYLEKIANYCIGQGFFEMMTNSITNAAYFSEKEQSEMVKMKNSLSAAFNILRPSLFETSMEVVAHNLNHKNNNLRLFEFGKAYHTKGIGKYTEEKKLCFELTGHKNENSWQQKMLATDFFALKGLLEAVGKLLGISEIKLVNTTHPKLADAVHIMQGQKILGEAGSVNQQMRQQFGIKQPVYFAELNWAILTQLASQQEQKVKEINKFPAVQRDLAVLVSKNLSWQNLKETVESMQLKKLQHVKLFDIFESDKLGKDKKSLAVNFVFQDEEKTLTDKEIDKWMQSIMSALEKNLQAEIRK